MVSREFPYASLVLLGLLLGTAAQAEIYKYIENGVVTYSEAKPARGTFKQLRPSCLISYIGCEMAHADWSRIPLNRLAFRELVETSADTHGVDAALIRAVIHAESNFNRRAISKAGAEGLMQLMPATQKTLRVRNPFSAKENIDAGTRLLKQLLRRYDNNIKLAAAAYNAGETAVKKYRGIPPYRETRNYVKRVTQLYSRYQR